MKKTTSLSSFTSLLMQWNTLENTRMMPWKEEKDPYKIWVSEIILQQTRVEQGRDYYLRFIKKFPGIKKLALAREDEVFKMWEGLGYYSRCKNMIATARYVYAELNGKFPDSYLTILQLKGIGPYTAAAIASFAFNLPYAVVDGNVSRVLARYFTIYTPVDSNEGKKEFALLSQKLLNKAEPAKYNQAIMDFGATVCKPKLPLCNQCLLRFSCKAFIKNSVEELPVKEKKIIKKNRWFYYVVLEKQGSVFIKKRNAKDIWQNLYEFMLIEKTQKSTPENILESIEYIQLQINNTASLSISSVYTQQLTHQTIHACFIHITVSENISVTGYELIGKKQMNKLAFPKLLNVYLSDTGWYK